MIIENLSARLAARVLGIVSPKIKRMTVTPTVANSTALFSSSSQLSITEVNTAATAVFTRLFPSKIGGSDFSGFSTIFKTLKAPEDLDSARWRIRTRCTDNNAASAPEKNADNKTKQIIKIYSKLPTPSFILNSFIARHNRGRDVSMYIGLGAIIIAILCEVHSCLF